MNKLEANVEKLNSSLLGTLNGEPGALNMMKKALEVAERNNVEIQKNTQQIDSLRLNWAKVTGITVAIVTIAGLVNRFFK